MVLLRNALRSAPGWAPAPYVGCGSGVKEPQYLKVTEARRSSDRQVPTRAEHRWLRAQDQHQKGGGALLQCSCREDPHWQRGLAAAVHRLTKSYFTFNGG